MHDLLKQRLVGVEGPHARRCVKEKDERRRRGAAEGWDDVESPALGDLVCE